MTKNFYLAGRTVLPDRVRLIILAIAAAILLLTGSFSRVMAQGTVLADLGSGEFGDISMQGFNLPSDARVTIDVVCLDAHRTQPLATDAWILDASTRRPVWHYDVDDSDREDQDLRVLTDEISLPAGTYEVYYTSYVDWPSDNWNGRSIGDIIRNAVREVIHGDTWLRSDNREEKFRDLKGDLGIRVAGPTSGRSIDNQEELAGGFLSTAFLTITGVPDERYIAEGFELKRPLDVEVYAIGEFVDGHQFDHGWIIDTQSRRKVWEMESNDTDHAGGASKNRMIRSTVSLEPGNYAAFFATDGSHSATAWNSAPPFDPDFWGLTLRVQDAEDLRHVSRFDYETMPLDGAVVTLREMGDNEHGTAGFSVSRPLEVRIYALGEGTDGRMFDYGWITNADTYEQVWRLEYGSTEHAGGARKNRVFDGVLKLNVGNYVAHFVTDASHSYGSWNDDRPYDADAWGITVAPVNASDADRMSAYSPGEDRSRLASITEVGDGAQRYEDFALDKDTRVRIFALGEGSGGRMFDYGWVESLDDNSVVWEMTYRMTEHGGGAQKNRMVNTTLLLPAGSYRVHYVSDGSHSFWDWNADPPIEAGMWGITVKYDRVSSAS
jgi:hypothetical protein